MQSSFPQWSKADLLTCWFQFLSWPRRSTSYVWVLLGWGAFKQGFPTVPPLFASSRLRVNLESAEVQGLLQRAELLAAGVPPGRGPRIRRAKRSRSMFGGGSYWLTWGYSEAYIYILSLLVSKRVWAQKNQGQVPTHSTRAPQTACEQIAQLPADIFRGWYLDGIPSSEPLNLAVT